MEKTAAVVGASRHRGKFGNKSLRAHQKAGYRVYPINLNPREERIEGVEVFHSLKDVPEKIDRVTVYLPPPLTLELLDEIAEVAPSEVFLNPGTSDDAVRARAEELGLPIKEACSIVALGMTPSQFPD
ncbi:MAG: CoA-binding protein [Acidobacteria bacterium]|nr:CoA-binding protein [Acidobacteriota bacterium]